MPCNKCKKYELFIQAMIKEWGKYEANKTAQYYKGQCEKVLAQNKGGESEIRGDAEIKND